MTIFNYIFLIILNYDKSKKYLESKHQPMDNLYVDKDRCIAIKTVADVKDIAKEQ